MLAGMFPGIDLGIGRAAGTDPLTTFALQRDRRQHLPTTSPSSWRSCADIWMAIFRAIIRSRASRSYRADPRRPRSRCLDLLPRAPSGLVSWAFHMCSRISSTPKARTLPSCIGNDL